MKRNAPLDATNYGPGSERGELGKAIVDAFARDVKATGAHFIIAHLPIWQHLLHLGEGGESPFAHLQDYFAAKYHYIPLASHLVELPIDQYRGPSGHYLSEATAVVGQVVAEEIISCVRDSSCQLSRFPDRSAIEMR